MKKTKIVATISDRNCDSAFLSRLYEKGMNVVRLNTAHQTPEDTLMVINNVRAVSDNIALLLDTKGPEIRTVKTDKKVIVNQGEPFIIKGNPDKEPEGNILYVTYDQIARDIPVGSKILIDDGEIEFDVVDIKGDEIHCVANNGGVVKSKKSVNIPKVSVNLPALSEKDREYIHFAIAHDVDFIAHSFVRSKEDVLEIQKILDEENSSIKIIAKIENQQGVDNIDGILEHVYGVMVARGDLAIEIPYEKIPGIQKMLINKCIEARKPVIIATQMLHSMIHSPRPTRAEVSDIANAIYSKADAIMLSGETAYGSYPVEAVSTMARVAAEVEKSRGDFHEVPMRVLNNPISALLIKKAVESSIELDCKAIIADSLSGRTIRGLSAYRGKKPILAQCYDKRIMRELSLSFGAYAYFMNPRDTAKEFITAALRNMLHSHMLSDEDVVVVLAGNYGKSQGASYIEISSVKNLKNG